LGAVRSGLDISAFVNNATHAKPHLAYNDIGIPGSPLAYFWAIRPLTGGITALYRF